LTIRPATTNDIAAIVAMTERLRASIGSPLPVDPLVTSRFVAGLLASPLGWVQIIDGAEGPTGFMAASIGTASISMLPICTEHGWWASAGGGMDLLRAYLAWAQERGCFAVRMSTPPENERAGMILKRCGFELAEQAWVRVL
jgi:RimJ/RimL family protein N-acetyltransferase